MRRHETAFIVKITAVMTHEFMNISSTIKETSGLMDDLLPLSEGTSFPHYEKFTRNLVVIREQVGRSIGIGVHCLMGPGAKPLEIFNGAP